MNIKYGLHLLTISSILIAGTNSAAALSVSLYDGSISPLPETQGYLKPGGINVTPSINTIINGVTVNTDIDEGTGYFGYSNYEPNTLNPGELLLVNNGFPALNQNNGYSIFFDVAVNTTTNNSDDRGSFTVLAISSNLKGIELDFDVDRIFAQSDTVPDGSIVSEFKRAETAAFTISNNTSYELKIDNFGYELFTNGSSLLSGNLRDYEYDITATDPVLPFNPYETESFLFLGDLTDRASGEFTLNSVAVTTSVPFNFSPTLGLIISGMGLFWKRIRKTIGFKPDSV